MSASPFSLPKPGTPPVTYVFKTVGSTQIEVDIYCGQRLVPGSTLPPIFVALHGGAWIGGNRKEFSAALIDELLKRGFLVASFDYRLLPESSFVNEQLEDVRSIESWVTQDLPQLLHCRPAQSIVVGGQSAGALLALLTPTLWASPPDALVAIYGPTNMHHLPSQDKGPVFGQKIERPDQAMVRSFADFTTPPSCTPMPSSLEDWLNDRTKFGFYMFRSELVVDILLQGLKGLDSDTNVDVLPQKGCSSPSEIDSISPLQLCRKVRYPPVCQVMGTKDKLFDMSHVTDFAAALDEQGITHEEIVVEGADHAFDLLITTEHPLYRTVTTPLADWIQSQSSN